MAQLFTQKVYSAGISGVVTVYTDPSLNAFIAQAEKYYVQVRCSQTSGTTSLALTLQSSNDGVDWKDKVALFSPSPQTLTAGAITYVYGTDPGTTPGGGLMRLKIDMTGVTPQSTVEIWLTGRSND